MENEEEEQQQTKEAGEGADLDKPEDRERKELRDKVKFGRYVAAAVERRTGPGPNATPRSKSPETASRSNCSPRLSRIARSRTRTRPRRREGGLTACLPTRRRGDSESRWSRFPRTSPRFP